MGAAKRALMLLAVEPRLKGVLIACAPGSAKSALARALPAILPERCASEVNGIDRKAATIMPSFIELPIGVTDDRLLGGIDLERTLATGSRQLLPGLLAQSDGGLLYADDVNLLDASIAGHLGIALENETVQVEREGLSVSCPARFLFIGTYNPAAGEVSRGLEDRVGLSVESAIDHSVEEAMEIIRRVLRFTQDPCAFIEEYAVETAALQSAIADARSRLLHIQVTRDTGRRIAEAALSLGVEGNRADVFATRAACASAALAGRDAINDEDIIAAIQFVLIPRATVLPESKTDSPRADQSEHENNEAPREPEDTEPASESAPPAIEELLIAAMDALPPDSALALTNLKTHHATAGKRDLMANDTRGRYAGASTRRPGNGKLALDATLRAAAPLQSLRRAQRNHTQTAQAPKGRDSIAQCNALGKERITTQALKGRNKTNAVKQSAATSVAPSGLANLRDGFPGALPQAIELRPFGASQKTSSKEGQSHASADESRRNKIDIKSSDLRYKRFKRRSGMLFIFAVDASGSMALNRMAQAKGALTRLLQQAYLHRDSVALISFRRHDADVLLAPTRSVELAKQLVDALPTGGATPIAAAIIKAIDVARHARLRGTSQAMLVLLTDGRSNVGLRDATADDRVSRVAALQDELRHLGARLQAGGIAIVVIDTKSRFVSSGEGRALAETLGGRYLYLPRADETAIHRAVAALAEATRRNRES